MNCSKYFYIRKHSMLLNPQVCVFSEESLSAYRFNWNNQAFKEYHNLDDSSEWKQNFVIPSVTQCKNYCNWSFILQKLIKQTAEVFLAEGRFSNHLPSSQILWCSGIANIITEWIRSNYFPSYTPISHVRPINKVFARGRY